MRISDWSSDVCSSDLGLAADRAVDLGQQAGRDLHEVEAAQGDSGGKAGEVADHAAAQRHQRCRALDLAIEELAAQPTELVEALRAIARRPDQALVPPAGIVAPALKAGPVQSGAVAYGPHDDEVHSQHRYNPHAALVPAVGVSSACLSE